jgi:hypothetical protein
MSDDSDSTPPRPQSSLRSPVRPSKPSEMSTPFHGTPRPPLTQPPPANPADPPPQDPREALILLRQKTETAVDEYARGTINRVQFNALYQRYNEQRAIIEKLMQRNPDSDAWRQVVSSRGQTGFLRARLEAQPLSFSIYAAAQPAPLLTGGPLDLRATFPAETALRAVWAMPNRPAIGMGRKPLRDDRWLVMAVGTRAATLVVFSLEPSKAQAQLLRDLHVDFERANQMALERGWLAPERLVFPQRALFEQEL